MCSSFFAGDGERRREVEVANVFEAVLVCTLCAVG